jgi:histone H2A
VVKADITDVVVDAIVHPTNTTFYLGGQVGSAIARRGGYKIQNIMNEMQRTKGHLSTCAGICLNFYLSIFFLIDLIFRLLS